MKELRYTLLTDGSSDRALIPILTWVLRQHGVGCPIQPEWADLGRLRPPPKPLSRIEWSLKLYPCDLLFVHRDAEGQSLQMRVGEIYKAVEAAGQWQPELTVCVIP